MYKRSPSSFARKLIKYRHDTNAHPFNNAYKKRAKKFIVRFRPVNKSVTIFLKTKSPFDL